LFDRSGRTVRLTAFARQVASAAGQALLVIEGFRDRHEPAVAGHLRLGAIPSVQTSALPVALRFAQADHPELRIQLTLDRSGALQAALHAGRIDAAVVVRPSNGGSSRLQWHDLVREPFVLIAPADAPGKSVAHLLRELPWIRYDATLTGGRTAARYVRKVCPGVRHAFEVADTDAIVAMVAEGLGVSVIPRPRAAMRKGYALRELSLGNAGPHRQIALACRKAYAEDRRIVAVLDAFGMAYRSASVAHGRNGRRD
jgi:DNA-binding transcriptional LysR family regulator